jgi:parallel beta-helix repeat protein
MSKKIVEPTLRHHKEIKVATVVFGLVVIFASISVVMAGDLNPPAAPAPTMKTLDEVEARIPIPGSASAVGQFVISQSGSYYLTGDRNCSVIGINVGVDNVTIDLNGYSLIGTGTDYAGVYLYMQNNIEIRNGTIRNFGTSGVYNLWGASKGNKVIDVKVIDNGSFSNMGGVCLKGSSVIISGCTIKGNSNDGINVGNNANISNCSVFDSNGYGIYSALGSKIADCTARENGTNGIYGGAGSNISGCSSYYNNNRGINVFGGSVIVNCSAYGNGGAGIGSGIGSMIKNCTANYNTEEGITVSSGCFVINNNAHHNSIKEVGDYAGIEAFSSGNRIEANNVTENGYGIYAATGNLVIKNSASGNTAQNYAGSSMWKSSDPNTAGPWYNFEF